MPGAFKTASSLRDAVSRHAARRAEMPLVHTSRCSLLPSIVKANQIETQLCNVFHEQIVYLFYGRPAYRSTRGSLPNEPVMLCPVTFIFKPGAASALGLRIYPCDTGALHGDRFKPHLTSVDREALRLGDTIDEARRYVEMMFGSNQNYFVGDVRAHISGSLDDAASRFLALLRSTDPATFDDRKSAVEVQVRASMPLIKQLLCVVLPREYMRDAKLVEAIRKRWKCRIEAYLTVSGSAPTEYYAVVRHLAERLYVKRKFL